MQQFTRSQLEALPTPELVKLYNTVSGKQVTRFSSREAGIKALLKALAANASGKLPNARTVRDGKEGNSAVKAGRPAKVFVVKLQSEGKIEVRVKSLRGQIMAYLKGTTGGTATIAELEAKFGDKVKAAVIKLMAVDWLTKVEQPA